MARITGLPTLLSAMMTLAAACGSGERPGPYHRAVIASDGGMQLDAAPDGPPGPDATGLCGNQFIPTLQNPPNIYFVLDRSTTMLEALAGSTENKYRSARDAIGRVLRSVGHRIRYGAAVFPSVYDACTTGREVFATRLGDPSSYAASAQDGPVLREFLSTLNRVEPTKLGGAGTPTSATLTALLPTVGALGGQTFVVLSTDGEPNCNRELRCTSADCSLNLRHNTVGGVACDANFNCCDPDRVQDGQLSCVDGSATVAAVRALASAGVKTYVIGMPGSEYFAELLDQMAVAGGTARYLAVSNLEQLRLAVMGIGVTLAISCELTLDQVPPDPTLVNVYFDRVLVPADPADGWAFVADDQLELRGAACDRLLQGNVLEVQIVAGCPTVVY